MGEGTTSPLISPPLPNPSSPPGHVPPEVLHCVKCVDLLERGTPVLVPALLYEDGYVRNDR